MKTVTTTELKTKIGETLDTAQTEPVTIELKGRAIAVIISLADYERLIRIENISVPMYPFFSAASTRGIQ